MKVKIILLFVTSIFITSNIHGQDTLQSKESTSVTEFKTVLISIDGMACQEGCADTIAENLRKVVGVNTAEVSYKNGEALIEYDNSLISINSLKKVITNTKVKNYEYVVKEVSAITNKIKE